MDVERRCSEECWPQIAEGLRAAIRPIKESSARVLLLLLPEYSSVTACTIQLLVEEGLAGDIKPLLSRSTAGEFNFPPNYLRKISMRSWGITAQDQTRARRPRGG
eukprot:2570301-Pyramimonas_sp.AAC.2